jgi:peptide/nickel transport system substrate-binding protein
MAQPNGGKLSRRTFLSAGAAAALSGGTALVFGCGGGSGRPSPSTNIGGGAVGPRRGGEIVIGRHPSGVLGIDPHIDVSTADIAQLIYSRLYTWQALSETAIFNDFALSVEIPDPKLQDFIFGLRPGVKIHSHPDNPASGEELTSEDCKQSFIRRGSAITAPDKRLALAIAGTGSPDRVALAAAMQTPDPYTFSIRLNRTFTPAFRELAKPEWSIIPAKVIEKYGSSLSGVQTLFGSGPFMLKELRGTERIVLIRHPDYFLSPRPWLDRIIFAIAPNPAALVSGLESGRLDAITAPISNEKYLELNEDSRYTTSRAPTFVYPSLQLKMQPPFSDIRVREAIDLALDREAFIDEIWGGDAKYNGPVPWPLERWALPQDELRRSYRYDPDRASELLEEAGYGDGFTARMAFARGEYDRIFAIEEAASLIADDLSKVGITLDLDEVELGSFIAETWLLGNFEMAFFPNNPYDDPDRPLALYHTRGISGAGNPNGYSNPEIDRLIDAQSQELDENRRQEIIHEAQRLMIKEHAPQITLPSGYEYHARRSYVHYPNEIGESPTSGAGPWGSDIWTEEA